MKAFVTGAQGFVGRSVVEELASAGHEVVAGARRDAPELAGERVTVARADLSDRASLARAMEGCDVAFHVAAKTGVWGPESEYVETNVTGTRNVLGACRDAGVRKLVFTSSPSVCFDGKDHVRASNDLPYPDRYLCAYPRTKAIAEREVLAANGAELATCALRPHLVIGPRDPHLIPRIVERARAGKLRIVGDGTNEVSLTWVANAALAHRLAGERLEPGAPHAGRAYFLGQREPVRIWDWLREVLERLGEPAPGRAVPRRVAWLAGSVLEGAWSLLRLSGEPPMTRFVALQLASSHSYDMAPAERDFGYTERIGVAEATDELVNAFRERIANGL